MCFDRNITRDTNDKFLECDCDCATFLETNFSKTYQKTKAQKNVLHKFFHPIGVHNGTGYTAHHSSSCFNPKLDDE